MRWGRSALLPLVATALGPPALLLVGLAASPAGADARTGDPWLFGSRVAPLEGSVISERPGFSSSPDATPVGRFNVEAGLEYGHEEQGAQDVDSVALPFALLRVGLVERLELRLGWGGLTESEIGSRSRDEIADPTLGFKWQITQGSVRLPRVGLIFEVALPVGEGTGSDEAEVVGALAWSQPLGERIGLFGTSTVARRASAADAGSGDDLVESTHAAGVGLALGPRWGSFVEYFVSLQDDARVDVVQVLDGGLTFLWTESLQLDLSAGVGLDDGARDLFLAAGAAYRW